MRHVAVRLRWGASYGGVGRPRRQLGPLLGKRGEPRLARLRELIGRAQQRCGARVTELRRVHAGLLELARKLEPPPPEEVDAGTRPGAAVQRRVETHLEGLEADLGGGRVSDWLREPVRHLGVVLRQLGEGL